MASKFPVNKELTALSLLFKNPDRALIADEIMPRSSVGTKSFEYTSIPRETMYHLPDDTIGPRGEWNSMEIGGTKLSASTKDRGLKISVSNDDQDQAANVDPKKLATQAITSWLQLKREKRVADMCFTAANYPAEAKTTLAGANQWSDITSNPLVAITSALDGMLVRGNYLVIGQSAWNVLKFHPRLVKAVGRDSGEGVITLQQLADLLEVNQVFVGAGSANIAKPGETVNLAKIWGKSCLAFFRDSTVSFQTPGITFGLTAEYGTRVAGEKKNDMQGLRGGSEIYVGESCGELIVSTGAAFLFDQCVA